MISALGIDPIGKAGGKTVGDMLNYDDTGFPVRREFLEIFITTFGRGRGADSDNGAAGLSPPVVMAQQQFFGGGNGSDG